ncbi:hypothetical protein JCM5350_002158 [Sporobolomyces pararoseus]
MGPSLASQMAPLIGLDEQTVSEQILPHLSTISSSGEIKNYLLTLLAPGKPSQDFIQTYLNQRFPPSDSNSSSNRKWTTTSSSSSTRSNSPLLPPPSSSSLNRGSNSQNSSIVNSRTQSSAPTPQPRTTTTTKPNSKGPVIVDSSIQFSESGLSKLKQLNRSLKKLDPTSTSTSSRNSSSSSVECFCSSRKHSISPFVPICTECGLVLCQLNSPLKPCPSCKRFPLLPQSLVESFVKSLKEDKESLLKKEKEDSEERKRKEDEERRRIKFPELNSSNLDYYPSTAGGGLSGLGYAGHAGGGSGSGMLLSQDRIQRAYESGISLNGRNFGAEQRANATNNNGGGKVLRLDGKGKVKVETKKKKQPSKNTSTTTSTPQSSSVEEIDEDDDENDGMVPWIDLHDDGIRSSSSSSSSPSTTTTTRTKESTSSVRTFENVTIKLDKRPVWIEREELNHSIVDEDEKVLDKDGKTIESVPDTRSRGRAGQ